MNNIKYFDTHAHINIKPLNENIDSIISELKENHTIINSIGVDIPTSISSIELSKKYKNVVFASIGIHPKDGYLYKNNLDETINRLEEMIINNKDYIISIGEIGLDYYQNDELEIDKEFQKKIFIEQIKLAKKYNLPINIHNRESTNDLLEILDRFNYDKVMIHCFSSNKEDALSFLKRNYMISIPGIVTFKNAINLHEALKYIPIENIVVETDCPFLTPVPFRGKVNKPIYVKYVLEEVAKIKNIDLKIAENKILENSLKFFNIKLNH